MPETSAAALLCVMGAVAGAGAAATGAGAAEAAGGCVLLQGSTVSSAKEITVYTLRMYEGAASAVARRASCIDQPMTTGRALVAIGGIQRDSHAGCGAAVHGVEDVGAQAHGNLLCGGSCLGVGRATPFKGVQKLYTLCECRAGPRVLSRAALRALTNQ